MKSRMVWAAAPAALSLVLAACGSDDSASGAPAEGGGSITVAGWGGTYDEATLEYYVNPFSEETGTDIQMVPVAGTHSAQIESQQRSGNIQWDMIDSATASDAFRLYDLGYIEPMPEDMHEELVDSLGSGTVSEFGITMGNNGLVIVCNLDQVEACPKNMTEFFDTEEFPGNRMLPGVNPYGLITAVMGTLVDPAAVPETDVDLDAVFGVLEDVRPSVNVFFESGDQSRQAIRSGEVDMGLMWSGSAYQVLQEGANLEINWGGVTYEAGYWMVQKDAPNKDVAFEFMRWIAEHPEEQASWSTSIGSVGVPNPEAVDYLDAASTDALPENPKNFDQMVHQNWDWYLSDDNAATVDQRFQDYLLG